MQSLARDVRGTLIEFCLTPAGASTSKATTHVALFLPLYTAGTVNEDELIRVLAHALRQTWDLVLADQMAAYDATQPQVVVGIVMQKLVTLLGGRATIVCVCTPQDAATHGHANVYRVCMEEGQTPPVWRLYHRATDRDGEFYQQLVSEIVAPRAPTRRRAPRPKAAPPLATAEELRNELRDDDDNVVWQVSEFSRLDALRIAWEKDPKQFA